MDAIILAYLLVLAYFLSAFYFLIVRSFLNRYKRFKCINCSRCCKLKVELSDKDIKRIKTDLDYIHARLGKKLIKRVNGYCVFLDVKGGKSSCSIYSMRPDICRNFPKTKIFGIRAYDSTCNGFK